MKMKFAVFLCFVFVTLKVTNGQPPGGAPTFTCQINGASRDLTITYTPAVTDTFVRMYIVGGVDPNCNDDDVMTGGLQISVTGLSNADPSTDPTQCGIQLDAANEMPTADIVLYLTQSTTNLLQSTDFEVTITAGECDFSNLNPPQNVPANAIMITDMFESVGATVVREMVTLTVVNDGTPDADVATCTLGSQQRLKLSMVLPSKTGVVTGIHPTTCTGKVTTGSPVEDTISLLIGSCTVADNVGLAGMMGFTPDGTLPISGPNTAFVTVMTEPFDCFRFSGGNSVVFECTVEFCTTALATSRCAGDTCANVANPLRRKRALYENSTESMTTSVTIVVGEHNPSSSPATNQECSGSFHQITFIAVVSILSVLLALSMGATVYVAKKSRRAVSTAPPYPVKGVDNLVF